MARPLIRQGEVEFDRRLLGLQLLEAGLDALAGSLGCIALPLASGPGMKGLDAPQLLTPAAARGPAVMTGDLIAALKSPWWCFRCSARRSSPWL